MCQAYEGEARAVGGAEKEALYKRFESYLREEIHLTKDELDAMAVRMLMLRDAGY